MSRRRLAQVRHIFKKNNSAAEYPEVRGSWQVPMSLPRDLKIVATASWWCAPSGAPRTGVRGKGAMSFTTGDEAHAGNGEERSQSRVAPSSASVEHGIRRPRFHEYR